MSDCSHNHILITVWSLSDHILGRERERKANAKRLIVSTFVQLIKFSIFYLLLVLMGQLIGQLIADWAPFFMRAFFIRTLSYGPYHKNFMKCSNFGLSIFELLQCQASQFWIGDLCSTACQSWLELTGWRSEIQILNEDLDDHSRVWTKIIFEVFEHSFWLDTLDRWSTSLLVLSVPSFLTSSL